MTTTVKQAITAFLGNIQKSNPRNTYKTYKSDLLGASGFMPSVKEIKSTSPIEAVTEEMCVEFLQSILDKGLSPATRQRKASTLREFIRFVSDEYDLPISVDRLNHKIKTHHLLKTPKIQIDYPGEKVERILEFSKTLKPTDLTGQRDLAFLWTLAETGLRVSEACDLKVGQIDRRWRATFIGKGNKQATVTFGRQSRSWITEYLKSRSALDKSSGLTLTNLPLFARHDEAVGKNKVKQINPKTAEKIIHHLARLVLGSEYDENITCHKLRHRFVTEIYRKKGIKVAKDMARHSDLSTTDRYAHRDSEENAEISRQIFG